MVKYKYKKRIGLASVFTMIAPMPFIGLLLYFYSTMFTGLWFYVLLPAALFGCLITYLLMISGVAALIYKMHSPVKEGTYSIYSKGMYSWLLSMLVLNIIDFMKKLQVPAPALKSIYQGIFNTKIGETLVMSGSIEHSLVDIGNKCVIGHHSEIWGHMIEGDQIYIKKVKIGDNVTVGAKTVIMPGAEIGDGTIIGACSLVPKNKKLEPNSLYLGVPVRKIKNLNPNV